MNKQEFKERLEDLGLPRSEYIILSGGSLLLRGLRESTADLDLCASAALAEALDLKNCPKDADGCCTPFENVQMKDDMAGREFDIVEGYQCQTLGSILQFKRQWGRPKDLKDIETIEAYIKAHNNMES